MQDDPEQTERFFGNRVVYGSGTWMDEEHEAAMVSGKPAPPVKTAVAGGFDAAENDDWTAIKLETAEGLLFTPTYGPDKLPAYWDPKEWNGKIPRAEVDAAWDEISRRYRLVRIYCDPGFHDKRSWMARARITRNRPIPVEGGAAFVRLVLAGIRYSDQCPSKGRPLGTG